MFHRMVKVKTKKKGVSEGEGGGGTGNGKGPEIRNAAAKGQYKKIRGVYVQKTNRGTGVTTP
jgi:hypothetical protein